MPSAAQLAHIEPTEGDGSSVVKNDDDSTQTSWPDGTVRLDEPDGSVIVNTMTVEVDGPNLTDEPVIYSTAAPVKVATVQGRSKFLPAVIAKLPAVPDDKNAIVKDYVSRSVVAET